MLRRLTLIASLALAVCCGGEDAPPAEDFECTEARDRWEQCQGGEVVWCHGFGTPHFHSGAKCALAGLACTEISERRAVCTDDSATCDPGAFACDGNTATNCIDGVLALEPCGTRKTCLADDAAGLATCFDDRPDAPCSGHGDLYASGCVCNRGYIPGPEGGSCVPG